jgi:pyruvate dehydrogenase E1 component alpha subunit
MPGVTVDGNDVEAVYAAARAAVDRARSGGGPTVIEATTMRMLGHAIHDGAEYVPQDLLASWEARDPVSKIRATLSSEGVPAGDLDAIAARCNAEVNEAIAFVEASPWPDAATVTERVYAD